MRSVPADRERCAVHGDGDGVADACDPEPALAGDLLWGARMVHAALEARGITHRYEEFDDDHSDIDYRLNESLPFVWEAIR